MYLLRVCNRRDWKDRDPSRAEDVDAAAESLLPDGGEDLSVFRATDGADGRRLAIHFGGTLRNRPNILDYILVPEPLLAPVECELRPSNAGSPDLRSRHCELLGLQDAERRRDLAKRLLAAKVEVVRISEAEMRRSVLAEVSAHPDLREHLREGWLPLLPPGTGPASE